MKVISTFKILFLCCLISGQAFAAQLYPYPESGQWGYINATGRMIVSPRYESANFFSDGLGKVSIIDERGEHLYGFIDVNGREVISPKFISVSDFSNGLARVQIRDKFAYLLRNGSLAGQAEYDYIKIATNGASIFRQEDAFGYMSTNGRVIATAKYDRAFDFRDGMAIVGRQEGRNYYYGYINLSGEEVVPLMYERARSFSDGLAAVYDGRDWIFIDKNGEKAFDKTFQDTGSFADGLAKVKIKNQWGYINTLGELVIPPLYQMADDFSNGLAVVGNNKLFGYINTQNEMVADYEFTRATRFDGKLARVSRGNKNGFMNGRGLFNLSDKISSIGSFFSGRARMKVGRYYGYYSDDAKLAIRPVYLYTSDFKEDLAITLAPIQGGYRASYISRNGASVKAWDVVSKPIPQHNDALAVITYPNVPFYRESDPTSTLIIKANFGTRFTKTYQRTATALTGHGLDGLLYSATYFGRTGFVFSKAVSLFPAPKIDMGIYPYFRDRFGLVSETSSPNTFNRPMNTIFLNGSTLSRRINRNIVTDTYFVPFMQVSEAFFIFMAAKGYPLSEYPERNSVLPNHMDQKQTARFTGRRDSDDTPVEFTVVMGKERLAVEDQKFGIELVHTYEVPTNLELPASSNDPVFYSNVKEEELIEKIETNDLLQTTNTPSQAPNSTNAILTNTIIESTNIIQTNTISETPILVTSPPANVTNVIDVTEEVLEQVNSN